MPQQFLDDPVLLDQPITSLTMEIHTVDAPHAGTDDEVYCNVVFKDGSLLFAPENFELDTADHDDRERGQTDSYALPIPNGLAKKIGEIDEFYIRKSGSDGWLLGSALLFANGIDTPVIGNSQINQFLDNSAKVLYFRDWSTRTLCAPSASDATHPLVCPAYRIAGPVLGQVSDTSANILYRVDREGEYRVRVYEAGSVQSVFDEVRTLSPTATFRVTRLQPNTHYRFSFFRVFGGQDIAQPDGDGAFRTFPVEGSGVRFSFAFGSCSRNRDDVGQTAWMGIRNLAPNPSADPLVNPTNDVRLFIHLGDTFYFYDDLTDEEPKNRPTILAANLSQRKQPGFLEMARSIPCVAVWDDHDFRKDNAQSTNYPLKDDSVAGFLDYWGNNPIDSRRFGLTTLITYGNVDIYLIDGRFLRDKSSGICFGQEHLIRIVETIIQRGARRDRLVILASGSTWNHTNKKGDAYGSGDFNTEREAFYQQLNLLIGGSIKGLVFLSGDIHQNEIHEIVLASGAGEPNKVAPEFVSSPLGKNSLKKAQDIKGERKWSVPSKGSNARRGFTTLDIDTTSAEPEGGWTIRVNYHDANATSTIPYHSQEYTLSGGQFIFT